jgi:chromosomal replication initiation ATPase DnaA
MTTAAVVTSGTADESASRLSEYERLADRFSSIYAETHSIAVTLEILDAERARETSPAVMDPQLPDRVVEVAASLFYVKPPKRLLRPGNHRDICAARWIASWLLRQQGWTLMKIAGFLSIDHSTVLYGLRRVTADATLRRKAHAALGLLVVPARPAAR